MKWKQASALENWFIITNKRKVVSVSFDLWTRGEFIDPSGLVQNKGFPSWEVLDYTVGLYSLSSGIAARHSVCCFIRGLSCKNFWPLIWFRYLEVYILRNNLALLVAKRFARCRPILLLILASVIDWEQFNLFRYWSGRKIAWILRPFIALTEEAEQGKCWTRGSRLTKYC